MANSDTLHDAERAVVGSILIDPSMLRYVQALLCADSFEIVRIGWIYDACVALAASGAPIDILAVTHELRRRRQLDEVGGEPFVMNLINEVPTAIHAEHYARIVAAGWKEREAIRLAQQIVQVASSHQEDPLDAAAHLLADLRKRHGSTDQGPRPMSVLISETLESAGNLSARRAAGQEVIISTPFQEFNRHLAGGLMTGDVVTVLGEPGVGKSTFAHMCADHAAARGYGVLAFITEMSALQFAARQLAPRVGVDSRTIRSGAMTSEQWERVFTTSGQVARPNFLVDDKTFDAQKFEARIDQAFAILERSGFALRMLIFDYLQLFRDSRRKDKRTEVGDIINQIREIANVYNLPVIVVSSLAREGYKTNAKPNLHNAKESGDIEYATTVGLVLWRDPDSGRVNAEIQKNRDGKAWQSWVMPPMSANAAWYEFVASAEVIDSRVKE